MGEQEIDINETTDKGSSDLNMQKPSELENTNIENSVEQLYKRIEEITKLIEDNITEEGLLPELNERSKSEHIEGKEVYGYNSEMLGYAMRIALYSNDKELFQKLYKGYEYLKTLHGNGLLQARLKGDLSVDHMGNELESWADGTQDTALALLEAGEKWGETYIQEGIELAINFINSRHVLRSNGKIYIFNALGKGQPQQLGPKLIIQDVSMWNFKLYEMMQKHDPNNESWKTIHETGKDILKQTLDTFLLPPNSIPILEDKVVNYETILKILKQNIDELITRPEIKEVILTELKKPNSNGKLYGWDSSRTPFRLTDTQDIDLIQIAVTINKRLTEIGMVGVNIQAEKGTIEEAKTFSPIVAPLLMTQIYQGMDISKALDYLKTIEQQEKDKETQGTFKTPLYWKLWVGLGLLQVKENIDKFTKK